MAVSLLRVKCTHGFNGFLDCPYCIQEEAEYLAWQRETDELAHAASLADDYLPATDREWREYLLSWDDWDGGQHEQQD